MTAKPVLDLMQQVVVGVGAASVAARAERCTISASANSVGDGVRWEFDAQSGSDWSPSDWSAATQLAFTIYCNGAHRLRCDIAHGNGHWTFYLVPRPGLEVRVVVDFRDLTERPPNRNYPGYLAFGGGPQPVDLTRVQSLTLTFNQVAPLEKTLTISGAILTTGEEQPRVLDPQPVVDDWGQWTGARGRPRTESEIRSLWQAEPTTFESFPGQTSATGAASGAALLPGTGYFQVAQDENRWWLADPDGFAFFSAGCDCVNPESSGPVREPALLADNSALETAPDGALWADFYRRNLRRRYAGDAWFESWAAQTVTRLRRWGFNTIANWSDPRLTGRNLIPYTTNVKSLAPLCEKLPDVWAPEFGEIVRALVSPEVAPTREDHLLIGYFVGNEPVWTFGGHRHPFNDIFVQDGYENTRQQATEWLQERFADAVQNANAAWGTALKSWSDLTTPGLLPDVRLGGERLRADADAFLGRTLDEFYRVCSAEIRAADPNHLLLGGRFYTADMADPYVRACRHFDVYSFNRYAWEPPADSIRRIERLSGRPVIIGEFHYGVEERGLTASLVAVRSQNERGRAYRHFVEQAAALPQVVGTHYFQWVDQPVLGRFDGECYNIGLVDATDIPYSDFLAHAEETHAHLYNICRGEVAPFTDPTPRPDAW